MARRRYGTLVAGLTAGLLTAAGLTTVAATLGSPAEGVQPVTGAVATTVNEAVDGTGHCKNGNPTVNCNIYDAKNTVWLSGLPDSAGVNNGTYFFSVLVPGGQGNNSDANPNDGTEKNLSDTTDDPYVAPATNADGSSIPSGDAYGNRTFTVTNGVIGYSGTHDSQNNKIRVFPYDDTTNSGGVYILAVCKYVPEAVPPNITYAPGVDPSKCKYDAFKTGEGEGTVGTPDAKAPTVYKTADGSYTTTWTWDIAKAVDKTTVKQAGGNATFNYTVNVTHDDGTNSAVKVTGDITVVNPNVDPQNPNQVIPISGVDVTDTLSDGTTCTVQGGTDVVLTQFETKLPYTCELSALPQDDIRNVATIVWDEAILVDGSLLSAGTDSVTFPKPENPGVQFTQTKVDDCVSVSDKFGAQLPNVLDSQLCQDELAPAGTYTYSRAVPVPQFDCLSYTNTASFVTSTTGTTDNASQTVTVCGPAKTGALTIGFWQNKNGQGIITGQAKTGTCPSATYLRTFAPFQDLSATATCSGVGTYVTNIIKAASSAGTTMNPMLKAQMLATSLDVYFSDPALGGNKINAPAPIGPRLIDLTIICKMIASSGGTSTCSGSVLNVSSAFGGATSLTVNQLLTYAASQSNVGGSVWYANVKAVQELAKNTFDAINNQAVFLA